MKHLNLAALIGTLGVLGAVSCTNVPPSPKTGNAAGVTVGNGIRAPCIPAAVANRRASITGTVDPARHLQLALQLPLRNQAELTQLLQDLYDPKSPRYHKYLSPSEFTERFGPTVADYRKVASWAKSKGLTVTATASNRRFVAIEAPVDTINRAFQVRISNYRHPTDERIVYSADREPAAAGLSVPLLQITGMSNYVLPRPMLQRGTAAKLSGSGPSGQYLPSDMRAAYYGKGPAF